jgi:ADP-heptose:LPS heptosyltransferase
MKIGTMRFLDKHAGVLPLVFLQICTRLCRRRAAPAPGEIKKILIIKFWGFGSIVLGYDLFGVIRAEFPHAYICALTLKQNRRIFEMTGLFDEVVDLDVSNIFRFAVGVVETIAHLRKKAFDVSVDLEFSSRFSSAVSCLIHARKRIGFQYDGVWRGTCYSDILQFREDMNLKTSYLKTAFCIKSDIVARPQPVAVHVGEAQQAAVDRLLLAASLAGKPLVGYNINASGLCLLRRWPKEYFVGLAEELIRAYSIHIVFIGAREDFRYVESAISMIRRDLRPHACNFAGKISLEQLAYVMTKFRLFVSNDSGPLHLAAYLKVPSVSFFGPETPLIYGPDGSTDTVFYKNPGCSPCIRVKNYKSARCRNNQYCLRSIKPAGVIDEIGRKKLL